MRKLYISLFTYLFTTIILGLPTIQAQNSYHDQNKNLLFSPSNSVSIPLPVHFMQRLNLRLLPKHKSSLKNANIQNTKIDTAVLYSVLNNPKRYLFSYTATGNRNVTETENLNGGVWVKASMDTATYDSVGNLLSDSWRNWVSGKWDNTNRKIYTYGPQRSLLSIHEQIWKNGNWVNSDSNYYSYNSQWDKVAYYEGKWNGNSWNITNYELYVYDSAENLTTTYRYEWNDTVWDNQQKYSFTYDTNGNVMTSTIENGNRQRWVNYYQETYTYDSANNMLSYIGKFWNDTSSSWVNSEKYTYTYNSSGYMTTGLGELWVNGAWVNNEKAQYFHDQYGGIESAMKQIWKNSAWADTTLSQYIFDKQGNATSGDFYAWDGTSWGQNQDGLLDVSYNYNLNQNYFTGYHVDAYYPKSVVAGVHNIPSSVTNLSCGPNPAASGYTNLMFNIEKNTQIQIYLYNLVGEKIQTIYEGTLNQGEHRFKVNLQSLPDGIYVAMLASGSGTKSIKIINMH